MVYKEKRRFIRIIINLPAFIEYEGKPVFGNIENLSNEGLFINASVLGKPSSEFKLHEKISATLYFLGINSTISMSVSGKIIRVTDSGVAIHSQELCTGFILYIETLLSFSDINHSQLTEMIQNYAASPSDTTLSQQQNLIFHEHNTDPTA